MRPAVITAVLLLVGIINTVTAQTYDELARMCYEQYDGSCVDNDHFWVNNKRGRCMKYFKTPKTFQEAQDHCITLESELVSIHDEYELFDVMCLILVSTNSLNPTPFWIGAKRSGDGFKYTDGTEVDYTNWLSGEPNNSGGNDDCVESNLWEWGKWNDERCAAKRNFVCLKK